MEKDKTKHPRELRGKKASVTDDVETADAKSGSVDERIPEPHTGDDIGLKVPTGATHIPPAGALDPHPDETGEGERVLEQERRPLRTPRRPG